MPTKPKSAVFKSARRCARWGLGAGPGFFLIAGFSEIAYAVALYPTNSENVGLRIMVMVMAISAPLHLISFLLLFASFGFLLDTIPEGVAHWLTPADPSANDPEPSGGTKPPRPLICRPIPLSALMLAAYWIFIAWIVYIVDWS